MALKHRGIETSPIWLIGDSDPERFGPELEYVFDDRHPTFHNIWTSIIYKIQKKMYNENNKLIEDEQFYIINAISDSSKKPGKADRSWDSSIIGEEKSFYLHESMIKIKNLIGLYQPKIIITFGAFAYEFIRRCEGNKPEPYGSWNTKKLRKQFQESLENENRVIPLLHRSISMGYFLSSHRYFSDTKKEYNFNGNYFEFVSEKLYEIFIKIMKT